MHPARDESLSKAGNLFALTYCPGNGNGTKGGSDLIRSTEPTTDLICACIYIYTHTHIYIYIYIFTYSFIYISTSISIYIYISIYMHIYGAASPPPPPQGQAKPLIRASSQVTGMVLVCISQSSQRCGGESRTPPPPPAAR